MICEWLWSGAPAGIEIQPDAGPIFPPVEEAQPESYDGLVSDLNTFRNYPGIEDDQSVETQLRDFCLKGYMTKCDTLQQVRALLGGRDPVLSKIGQIVKTRKGRTKRRMILDIKESGVGRATRKTYRVVLPRVTDAVRDGLESLSEVLPDDDETLEYLVLDFVDAFWQIPLAQLEKRYFVGQHRNCYYVFNRTAQGSRNGPFAWGSLAALGARLTQSLFISGQARRGRKAYSLRMQVYVDDPLSTLRGTPSQNKRNKVVLIVSWLLMGFELAFDKSQEGDAIDWIGFTLKLKKDRVEVTIPEDKLQELEDLFDGVLKANVIGEKELRSLAGKTSSIASVIYNWRPFVSELWAALGAQGTERGGAPPPGCIWTKQIARAVQWMRTFICRGRNAQRSAAGITRVWLLESYLGRGPKISITFDASPFGLGAVLQIDGRIVRYFANRLMPCDEARYGRVTGSCEGQQTWEALCILVALRCWSKFWQSSRIRLLVRGDNVAALQMLLSLKAKGTGPASIARELAIDLGDGTFRPDIIAHLPGVANVLADECSRKFDPAHQPWQIPRVLRQVQEDFPVIRDANYYIIK
jgi:hypothetical protein